MRKSLLKSLALAITISGSFTMLNAQSVDLHWVQPSGGEKAYTIGKDVVTDSKGNSYSTGYFTGKVTFYSGITMNDPVRTTFGEQDAYIMKYNAKGQFVWVIHLGATKSYATGVKIAYDENTNLVSVLGEFSGQIGYDAASKPRTSKGGSDIFITTVDAENGKEIWTKTFGGKESDLAGDICVDEESNLFATGSFDGDVSFDGKNTFSSAGGDDAFVMKLSAKGGDIAWAKHLVAGPGRDMGTGIAVKGSGVNVTGIFSEKAVFDPADGKKDMKAEGAEDMYLGRLGTEVGQFEMVRFFGGEADDYPFAIAADEGQNLYLTGRFSGKVNFDPAGKKPFVMEGDGKGDVFIAKYNPEGMVSWAGKFGGVSRDEGKDIKVDKDGNVYSVGTYLWEVDFNIGTGAKDTFIVRSPGQGYYLHKIDAKGNFQWVKVIESREDPKDPKTQAGTADVNALALLEAEHAFYTNGSFYNTTDFDPNAGDKYLTMKGNTDAFLQRLVESSCANGSTVTQQSCDVYAYNGTKYTTSGTYNHIFKNQAGCDSTVTLVLTINKSAATTVTKTECDSYVFDGKTLTSSGTYTQTLKTTKGCDSVITLNLTINKSYTGTHKETTCDSFSLDNKLYYTQSGSYKQVFKTSKGCDSTVNLDLVINKSSDTSVTITACDNIKIGNQEFTESGVYELDFKTAAGCDSTVTLNLEVTKLDRSVSANDKTLTANAVGVAYQWLNCDDDMKPIPGETKQYFTATQNGNYAVEIKKEQCTATSDCYEVTGIKENSITELNGRPLNVFPNPATSHVVVDFGSTVRNADIHLINLLGQVVKRVSATSQSTLNIDVHQLPSGIYMLEVTEEGQTAKVRFVKD